MDESVTPPKGLAHRRMKQVLVLFAIIAGFFLVLEHGAHAIPYLPWLFLLACPFMHIFMHHGHAGHNHGGGDAPHGRDDQQPGAGENLPADSSPHHPMGRQ